MAVTISSPEPSLTITNATNQITFSLGRAGADGQGVVAGGTTGQILAKASGTDYDTEWITAAGTGDLLAANNLSDVASAATAFGNIKQAASTTATGVVELATDGEALAGKVVQGDDSRLSDTRDPNAHASEHTDGTDDIQSATNAQKGLATAAHITAIEANTAKVTCNTANVTAAGALMDSEVTNLAQVKAFDSSDYATAAQGSLADSALQSGDNISVLTNDSGFTSNTGTVDTSGVPVLNDFARFTDADTIEGRSYTEVKSDLSLDNVENTAISTWTGSANIATVGTITSGTWNGTAIEGTSIASTGETGGSKFLREDGDGTCSWQTIAGGGDALTSSPLSQFAATTSSQLAGVISDETGSGALVFATSPTLTTPNIGTPSAGVLTNATGLPLTTGVTGTLPVANGGTGAASLPSPSNYTPGAATVSGHLSGIDTALASAGGGAFSADGDTQITPTTAIVLDQATGNEIGVDIAYTVNKATSGNDTGLRVSMTDTASPGTSLLIDAIVGGTSQFSVDLNGVVSCDTVEIASFVGDATGAALNVSSGVLTDTGGANAIDLSGIFYWDTTEISGDLKLTERADHAGTPGAGLGFIWVKSDTPNTLYFTDDAGTDHNLTLASSATQPGDNISTLTNDSGFTTNTGTVDTSGTPVANDFARFTDADTIEGRSYSEVRTDLNVAKGRLGIVIDGAGSAITTGIKADLEVPYACTVNEVRLLADQSGSAVVDIWKSSYAAFPPLDSGSITSAAPPTLTTATKSEDSTLTGWTTSLSEGDILRFNVDSASTVTRLTVVLEVTRA